MKPVISIVGRPNVGKSTLFNRIIGYKKAITEDTPGVTRDRNYGEFDYSGRYFILADTGGFEPSTEDNIFRLVEKQIHTSMDESSAIIFVLDGKDGVLPQDEEIADILRKYDKPVFYTVNKVDSSAREHTASEFYRLGAKRLYTVSALHGLGIAELLEDICSTIPARYGKGKDAALHEATEDMRVAIVGRPNTGKSSITNKILGSDRMIVSDIPGTTRDAVDTKITFRDKDVIIIDTAGLRRKSKISKKIEAYSVSSAIKTIEKAHVVNLILDASEGISHQDAGIAHMVSTYGKGLCLVFNKWDLVKGRLKEAEYKEKVQEKIPHCSFSPVVFTSAKTGQNIEKILDMDIRIFAQLSRRINTPDLNKSVEGFLEKTGISYTQGKQVKIYYVNQIGIFPPTFLLFSNYPELIPEHYKRYLENSIRSKYGFKGAPIRLLFRKK